MTLVLPGFPKGHFSRWPYPRVLAMVGDVASGCSLWRVLLPFSELQRQGAPPAAAEWGPNDLDLTAALIPNFDAVLLPRLSWESAHQARARRWVDDLHREGRRVWYELDDDLLSPWIIHQVGAGGGIRAHEPPAVLERERQQRLHALSLCDGVTVTSQRLATVVREFTSAPVVVVPNYADWRWCRAVLANGPVRTVDGLTVGWAGGARPDRDLEAMAWAWGQLAQTHPEVRFVVQGHQPAPIYEQVPRERITAIGWLPIEQYLWGLRNVDIACCPLAEAPFNRCKTPIKAMEAAACGAAVVASPTIYRQVIANCRNGYLCETREQWLGALTFLVEAAHERRRVARELRRTVATDWSLEANAWRWPVAWRRLWEQGAA